MGKLIGVQIQNFGSLRNIKMGRVYSDPSGTKELTNMVAIIGKSGTGKSTLADAFGFIADCFEKDVEAACDANGRGGYERIVSQGATEPIRYQIYYRETSNEMPITYELAIGLDNNSRPIIVEERLRQRRSGAKTGRPLSFLRLNYGKGDAFLGSEGGVDDITGIEDGKKVDVNLSDPRKLGIVTLGELKEHPRIEKFKNFLKSWFLCYFSPGAAREIPNAGPQQYLDKIGKNLNNVAQFMERDDKYKFKKILEDIQSKLPGIESIESEKMPNGQLVLKFKEKGFSEPFYSQKMSDGTLKLVAYYLLLNEKNPRSLVFVEEPENGLYHQYLPTLALEMKKSIGTGFSRQLFVTTHSPFFVNSLTPDEVWVLEKLDDGFTNVKRASEYEFVSSISEEGANLGDLWYNQYFG